MDKNRVTELANGLSQRLVAASKRPVASGTMILPRLDATKFNETFAAAVADYNAVADRERGDGVGIAMTTSAVKWMTVTPGVAGHVVYSQTKRGQRVKLSGLVEIITRPQAYKAGFVTVGDVAHITFTPNPAHVAEALTALTRIGRIAFLANHSGEALIASEEYLAAAKISINGRLATWLEAAKEAKLALTVDSIEDVAATAEKVDA